MGKRGPKGDAANRFPPARTAKPAAFVGVADHAGWAVLMTVAGDGSLIDRRRVELIDDALPKLPHHHECQALPPQEAVELVERVRASAERRSRECLDALAASTPMEIIGIAIRRCPPLPESIAERLSNYRAQNVADTVMYRKALADAASNRGWFVHWYDRKIVFDDAAIALQEGSIEDHFRKIGETVGPPWRLDHRSAMAAAMAAAGRRDRGEAYQPTDQFTQPK